MSSRLRMTILAAAVTTASIACGGSTVTPSGPAAVVGSPVAPGGGVAPSAQAPTAPGAGAAPSTPIAAAATPGGSDATAQAQAVAQFRDIASLVLASPDVPAGYKARTAVPVPRTQVIAAQIGIRKLASYMLASDLEGAWAVLYVKDDQSVGLSSVVTRYRGAGNAAAYVDVAASLVSADYPAATSIEQAQADTVGDKSVFLRTRLPGARILEYTWSQGRLVGQVILRYSGDTENPDDAGLLVSLARKQAAKMQSFNQ